MYQTEKEIYYKTLSKFDFDLLCLLHLSPLDDGIHLKVIIDLIKFLSCQTAVRCTNVELMMLLQAHFRSKKRETEVQV